MDTLSPQNAAVIGPKPKGFVCQGCPAFRTNPWREPSGDGETYDRGSYAWCDAADHRSMGAYHYPTSPTPDWCPARAEPPKPAPSAEGVETFQSRAGKWVVACFGDEISCDELERMDRAVEEFYEGLQTRNYPRERLPALENYVWSRPVGDTFQEIGGIMMTLAAWCCAMGVDMHAAGETELARVWTKVDVIRAKQATKPTGSALPIALSAQSLTQAETVGEPVAVMCSRCGVADMTLCDCSLPYAPPTKMAQELYAKFLDNQRRAQASFASPADARRCSSSGPEPGPGEGWPAVPAGWRLVPEEPTEAMLMALDGTMYAGDAWDAALAAAPPSPGPETGVEISEEMVERAALALQHVRLARLRKLWETKGESILADEPSGMRDDARACLTAALKTGKGDGS
jgi:hypothetical protein